MKFKALVSICAAAFCALTAHHASATDVAASLDVGTTGFGLHVTTPIATQLNARVGVNFANYNYDGHTSDIDYDFKLKLATFDALLDYHPFDGAFRVSAGAVYNGNKIEARGKPAGNGTYDINGHIYSAAAVGSLDGKIDFRKLAPYVGIGWGNAVKTTGWGFGMDLGVTFSGSPKTSLSSSGCTLSTALCAQLGRDIGAENARLADEVDDFKFYPVIRVGASYRF